MGAIYKVHHNLLDEIRVIKFMRAAFSGDPDLHRRFLQEAKLVTRFKHANIAAVYDFALDDDGTAYIVMEYIDGLNLGEVATALRPLPVPLVLEMMRQTLDALGYLHRKNVVHRDISPDNMMLTLDDDRVAIKLIDLGIAKALDAETGITKTGLFLGKLKYASPEQLGTLQGDERLDGRSDLYSLGIVMYELLTGRLPFAGTSAQSLIAAHLIEAPVAFDVADPDGRVPLDVRNIVMRSLSKDRRDRFASADEVREALQLVQHQLHAGPRQIDITPLRELVARQHEAAAAEAATPSAQERMNRQFGFASTTPPPVTPFSEPTLAATRAVRAPRPAVNAETVAIEQPDAPSRTVPKAWLAASATAAVALLAIVAVLLTRDKPVPPQKADPPPVVTASQSAAPVVPVTGTTLAEPVTATLPAPVAATTVTEAPTTAAAPRPAVNPRSREVVPVRPTPAPVTVAPAVRIVNNPPPQISTTEEKPASREPDPPVAAPRPAATTTAAQPVADPRPAAEDAIRDVIAAYVSAQEALDPDRYVRVYPSADKGRVTTAFNSFRSQDLDVDIDRIDVNGTRATVRAQETRVAVPRAGSVQRVTAERSFTLEQRGSGWVIVAIR